MGDHYIPQLYLRGFAQEPERRSIFMYQRGLHRRIHTNLRNVAQQTKFYSRDLESHFANKVEAPVKPILDKITGHEPITDAERSSFVAFVVALYRRVPTHKEMVRDWLNKNADPYYDKWENEIRQLRLSNPDKTEILDHRLAELAALRKEKRITPETVWYQLLSSQPLHMVSWAIENMRWQFLVTDDDAFLTSDNPVFFFKKLGVGRMNSELTFPVSNRTALLATWQADSQYLYRAAADKQIQEINRRTASSATKYVFFSRDCDWIPNLLNKSWVQLHPLTKDPSNNQLVRTPWHPNGAPQNNGS